jgi:hypothetical protein
VALKTGDQNMTDAEASSTRVTIRRGAIAAWFIVIVGAISSTLFGIAADWNLRPSFQPSDYLTAGHAQVFRWAAFTDMFSYYLPFLLVVLAVHASSRDVPDDDRRTMAVAGVLYVIVGSIGAVLLATAGASLIQAHVDTGDPTTVTMFKALTDGVFVGLWQILEVVFAAVWWFGMARTWADSTLLRLLGYIMGVAGIVTAAARMLQLDDLAWVSVLIFVLLWLPAILFVGFRLQRLSSAVRAA